MAAGIGELGVGVVMLELPPPPPQDAVMASAAATLHATNIFFMVVTPVAIVY
jgi:hypothetical protein